MAVREEVRQLVDMGPFPSEDTATEADLKERETLLKQIQRPVTNEEARVLVTLFGPPDTCFGLAWTLLHLIETAPGWPIAECLNGDNEWQARLRQAAQNAGYLIPNPGA